MHIYNKSIEMLSVFTYKWKDIYIMNSNFFGRNLKRWKDANIV